MCNYQHVFKMGAAKGNNFVFVFFKMANPSTNPKWPYKVGGPWWGGGIDEYLCFKAHWPLPYTYTLLTFETSDIETMAVVGLFNLWLKLAVFECWFAAEEGRFFTQPWPLAALAGWQLVGVDIRKH